MTLEEKVNELEEQVTSLYIYLQKIESLLAKEAEFSRTLSLKLMEMMGSNE